MIIINININQFNQCTKISVKDMYIVIQTMQLDLFSRYYRNM